MKNLSTFCLIAFSALLFSCSQSKKEGIRLLSPQESQKTIKESGELQLVDVRTPEEYAEGHVAGSINLDYNSGDFAQQIKTRLDPNKPVMVYCFIGGRSAEAAKALSQAGFKEVMDMKGGYKAWKNASLPIEIQGGPSESKAGMPLSDFEAKVKEGFTLIDFNAPWCPPCRKMAPYMETLASKTKVPLQVIPLNADENETLVSHFGIEELPQLQLYSKGQLIWKHSGYISENDLLKELETWMNK